MEHIFDGGDYYSTKLASDQLFHGLPEHRTSHMMAFARRDGRLVKVAERLTITEADGTVLVDIEGHRD